MVGYEVIGLAMHVLFSRLQSMLMQAMSLFYSTSAAASNSGLRF